MAVEQQKTGSFAPVVSVRAVVCIDKSTCKRQRPNSAVLATLASLLMGIPSVAAVSWAQVPGVPPSATPLRPFQPLSAPLPPPKDPAAAPSEKADGLPPLPLFAQNAAPAQSLPFATPAPGSLVDEDEDENQAEAEKKRAQKQKRIECNSDDQCPAQSVCALHICKSIKPMTSAFIYYHRPGPIGFRMVVPFYFHFWHPQHSTRVLAPFFADRRDHEEKSRNLWVFPTYQYKRTPEERTHRIWPLFFYSDYGKEGRAIGILPFFYSKQRGSTSTNIIPPLLYFERHDEKARERDTVFLPLLLYVRQRQEDTLGLFLGLGYYRRSADKVNAGYFPLIHYSADAAEHKTAVLPLFFEGGNSETGMRYAALMPFFLYYRSANQNRLYVTPLGARYVDHETQEDTTGTLVPPMLHRDTPTSRLTVLLPLAAYWHNKQSGQRVGFAGPLFFSRDDEGGSEGVIPLYLRFHSNVQRSSTTIIPPLLAALHHSPTLRMGFIGPLYGWSRSRDGAYGGGLLPLVSFATGPRPHAAILPPLFIYSADRAAGRYHVSIGPLFYRAQTQGPETGYDAGIFPLLFVSRHGDRSTQALLPIFYHHRQPGSERLWLGPFYYDRRCPRFVGDTQAAVHAGLLPLFFWKRSPEHSYTALVPLFFEAHTPTDTVAMAGPVFFHRKKLGGSSGDRITFGVFPLFYARKSAEESLVVAPLGGYRRTAQHRTLFIGPYVENVTAPGQPEQSITRVLFPLFFFHCSADRKATVLFPFFMQIREEKTTFRSVLLLYNSVNLNQGETRAHVLLPLFFALRTPSRSTTVVGPFFHHRDEKSGSRAVGLLPLFAYGRDVDRTVLATPIGFYQNNHITGRTRSAFLLFYGDFQRNRDDFGVVPLFFATRRGTARTVFALPFFFDSRDPAENRAFTMLGPLFFGHKKTSSYGGFLPLVFGKNDGDGGYSFLLFPLLYASHRPQGSTWLATPAFGFQTGPAGYRFYLGPFYLRRDENQRSLALFPLFYDGRNLHNQDRLTFLLPLFLRDTTAEKSLTMITPLFWQHRTLTRRVTLLFPLALDVHDLFRERLTAVGPVVPLFVRMRNESTNTTSWIFPPILTYVKREPNGITAITFPIIWHIKSAEKQTTVLFPLVYYFSRPATKTVVVLPLFGYSRDEHNNRSLLLLPLFTWARNGSDGSRERVVFPLFWHFKSESRQTSIFFPLIWHARRQNYTVTVFLPFGAHWRTDRGHYTLVLNTYIYKGSGAYQGSWEFQFWPLFSVGRPHPNDFEWSVLSGFVGYSREGIERKLRLLWIPIKLEPAGTKTVWYGASWRMASGN